MAKPATGAKPGEDGDDDAGMDLGELRKFLKLARKGPVQVAFAVGGDGKAIVVMDRRRSPRALEKEIKDGAPDSKNHRFGTVSVDPDDPKLVRFTVNKSGGGLQRKLMAAIKGTGFSKVEVTS